MDLRDVEKPCLPRLLLTTQQVRNSSCLYIRSLLFLKIIIPKPRLAASFIRVVGSEFVQKYLGEGPRMVRDVFRLARENAPAIIFIDEIDAIATKRFDAQTGGEYLSSYFAHTRLCGVCRWCI